MLIGYIRKDVYGLNYLVPEYELKYFELIQDIIIEAKGGINVVGKFEELFDKYRIDGVESLKVIIEE